MVNPEFLPDHEEHEESSIQAHYEAFSIPKDNLIHIFSKETCPQDADFLTLKQQADKGDLYAQLRVGLCYEHGEGIKRSYESAFHYYQLAADKGHFDAQTALAKLYEQGLGIKQSDQQAFHYYRLAADQGHPGAQIKVGDFYEKGRAVQKNPEEAIRYYEKGLEQKLPNAWVNLVQSPKKAFEFFKLVADRGNKTGQYWVGQCYQLGCGVQKSLHEAAKYYQLAAQQGLEKAFKALSELKNIEEIEKEKQVQKLKDARPKYHTAVSLKKSLENDLHIDQKEFENIKQAAEKGKASSQLKLGRIYEEGKIVQQSDELAFHYFQLAANNGNAEAWFYVGRCFMNGKGVEQSKVKAARAYQEGAVYGCNDSRYQLALCYLKGEGIEQSVDKGIKYLRLAALNGIEEACIKLADLLEERLGLKYENRDIPLSKRFLLVAEKYREINDDEWEGACLKIAEDIGTIEDPTAQLRLADFYHNGSGYFIACEEKAAEYFKMAASYQYGIDLTKPYSENLVFIRSLANLGNAVAFNLGVDFHFGKNGLQQSYEEAFNCFNIAANKGNSDANYNLGIYFKTGFGGIQQSYEEAFRYFKLAADHGCPNAQCAVGDAYRAGEGVQQSDEKALEYYRLAANYGNAKGQYNLGRYLEKGLGGTRRSPREAKKYFRLAAEQNYAPAQFRYGLFLRPHDSYQYFLKLATEQGNTTALYGLGYCYQIGRGVEESWDEAKKYYQQAAEKGFQDAIRSLSELEMLEDIKTSAEKGSLEAQLQLGKRYKNGQQVQRSMTKSYKYYQKAAVQGHPEAQYLVGEFYRMGDRDFKESWKDALKYYKLAAHQGHIKAIRLLFDCYHHGKKVEESQAEAVKYLFLGVRQHDPECQFQLGTYYANGWGNLTASFSDAIKYWKLAAAQGNDEAKRTIKIISDIIHPHAQIVDMSAYLLDGKLSTLESIFKICGKKPIFLSEYEFNWEEAQVIRDAMIDNPHFTVIGSEAELARLSLAFELKGFVPDETLYSRLLTSAPKLYGCVFIASEKDMGLENREKTIPYLKGYPNDPNARFYVTSFRLFEKIENNIDSEATFNYFKELADKGNAEAQFYLSTFYLEGKETKKSEQKAFRYAKLAADQGLVEAQYNLAVFYKKGVGTNKSTEQSLVYLQLGREQDFAPSQHLLAQHYQSEKEEEIGLEYFQKAAEKGYVPSLISLGEYYLRKKNAKQALLYFQKAIEQKDMDLFYEKWRLEKRIERCKKEIEIQANYSRAQEIHKNLATEVIFYPDAQQLDLNHHPKNERLAMLEQTLMDLKNQSLHVYGSNLSFEELVLIRNAMLENPRITVVCPRSDSLSLIEAFYRIGYDGCLKELKLYKKDKELWSGFLFVGKSIKPNIGNCQ